MKFQEPPRKMREQPSLSGTARPSVGCILVVIDVAVLHPLPYVAVHVVQPKAFAGYAARPALPEPAHRRSWRRRPRSPASKRFVHEVGIPAPLGRVIAERICCLLAGTRGILPFGLGQQPYPCPSWWRTTRRKIWT